MMELNEIKKLLHHREPYLMVDKVVEISSVRIKTEKNHRGDEAHLAGHFPGAPIVPGAMLQEIATQSAGILITKYYSPVENYDSELTQGHALGVLKKIEYAKFSGICFPSKPIIAEVNLIEQVSDLFLFDASIFQSGEVKAKLGFKLINIDDSHLYQ